MLKQTEILILALLLIVPANFSFAQFSGGDVMKIEQYNYKKSEEYQKPSITGKGDEEIPNDVSVVGDESVSGGEDIADAESVVEEDEETSDEGITLNSENGLGGGDAFKTGSTLGDEEGLKGIFSGRNANLSGNKKAVSQ